MASKTIAQALAWARNEGLESDDARWLLEHILGSSALKLSDSLSVEEDRAYLSLVKKRKDGMPLAYVIGTQPFWNYDFTVNPNVLIPRSETELLVEQALLRGPVGHADVLDMGTGSGCVAISLALERPQWTVSGLDISGEALIVAQRNALNLNAKVEWVESYWFDAMGDKRWDLILSNPPYIDSADLALETSVKDHEPHQALFAGKNGLESLIYLVDNAIERLNPCGWLVLEHGHQQGAAVAAHMRERGYGEVQTLRSLAGHERVTCGRRPVVKTH